MSEAGSQARAWFFRVWTLIGALVVLGVTVWVLREPLQLLLAPVALALVIVYLLNPSVGWLARRGAPRGLATGIAYLVVLGGLAAFVTAASPLLFSQVRELGTRIPEISQGLEETVNRSLLGLGVDLRVTLDPQSEQVQATIQEFLANEQGQFASLLRGAGEVLTSLLHVLLVVVFAPILAFYLLADLPRISAGIRGLFPPDARAEFVEVVRRIGATVGAYFRAQLAVAVFVGVATALGLALVGLPFWAVVGGVAGAFNLIPLIGPFVGGLLGVVVALTVGTGVGQAVAVVAVMVVVQQIDNHVVTPNIVARTVRLHPVTVILGLTVAGSLFGILGMFVAVPVIATVKLLLLWLLVTRVPAMAHLAGEEVSVLRDDSARPADERVEGSLAAMGRDLRDAVRGRRRSADRPDQEQERVGN